MCYQAGSSEALRIYFLGFSAPRSAHIPTWVWKASNRNVAGEYAWKGEQQYGDIFSNERIALDIKERMKALKTNGQVSTQVWQTGSHGTVFAQLRYSLSLEAYIVPIMPCEVDKRLLQSLGLCKLLQNLMTENKHLVCSQLSGQGLGRGQHSLTLQRLLRCP